MAGAILAAAAAIGGAVVAISNQTISDSNNVGGSTEADYQLTNAGVINGLRNNSTTLNLGNWITPQSGMSGYDARAQISSGPTGLGVAVGTFGSTAWLNLGTTRFWGLSNAGLNGNSQMVITVDIRPAGGGATLATATITLNANSN